MSDEECATIINDDLESAYEENESLWAVCNGKNAGIYRKQEDAEATGELVRFFTKYEMAMAYALSGYYGGGNSDPVRASIHDIWFSSKFVRAPESTLTHTYAVMTFKAEGCTNYGFKISMGKVGQIVKDNVGGITYSNAYTEDAHKRVCALSKGVHELIKLCFGEDPESRAGGYHSIQNERVLIAVNDLPFVKKMRRGRKFSVAEMEIMYRLANRMPVKIIHTTKTFLLFPSAKE